MEAGGLPSRDGPVGSRAGEGRPGARRPHADGRAGGSACLEMRRRRRLACRGRARLRDGLRWVRARDGLAAPLVGQAPRSAVGALAEGWQMWRAIFCWLLRE